MRVRLPDMLYLASRSPRRAELLSRLGLRFGVLDPDIPECRQAGEPAGDYVRRVAREKAGAGLLEVQAVPGAVVLGADTEVILDGHVFGKPADAAEAAAMLRALSGRTHEVLTAVSVVSAGREAQAAVLTRVTVDPLESDDIERYLACGQWQGKAGGYAIQGRFEMHVARLEGSYSGVMGLPLRETVALLRGFGVQV